MRFVTLKITLTVLISLGYFQHTQAQARAVRGDPLVIQIIQLEYAKAEELAAVLTPFLSPEGRIVAYNRTNSLIIKDRAYHVNKLVEIIKGPAEKSEDP
jgi:type II secretory pathway component GspD/PulD (secretin)